MAILNREDLLNIQKQIQALQSQYGKMLFWAAVSELGVEIGIRGLDTLNSNSEIPQQLLAALKSLKGRFARGSLLLGLFAIATQEGINLALRDKEAKNDVAEVLEEVEAKNPTITTEQADNIAILKDQLKNDAPDEYILEQIIRTQKYFPNTLLKPSKPKPIANEDNANENIKRLANSLRKKDS